MTDVLTCYGDDIRALADSASDFDASSVEEASRWYRMQWTRVSKALHWSRALPALEGDVASMETIALASFERWLLARQTAGGMTASEARAQARSQAVNAIEQAFPRSRNAWRPDIPSRLLPGGACYDDGGPLSAEQQLVRAMGGRPREGSRRAFRADVAPSYFGPRHTTRPKGCEYPVVLSLGTYPYVYGGVLGLEPPGLRWSAGPSWRAMRVASRFWRPEYNLLQDARVVVLQYRHFIRTTEPFVQTVPASASSRSQVRAQLFRDGGRLRSTGALSLTRVRAPRGDLSASAYNYCLDAFAAFFAARRSFLRSVTALSPVAARALATNPDTCMRVRTSVTTSLGV